MRVAKQEVSWAVLEVLHTRNEQYSRDHNSNACETTAPNATRWRTLSVDGWMVQGQPFVIDDLPHDAYTAVVRSMAECAAEFVAADPQPAVSTVSSPLLPHGDVGAAV